MKQFPAILFLWIFLFCTAANAQNLNLDINHISAPAIDWTLTIDLNNFEAEENNIIQD